MVEEVASGVYSLSSTTIHGYTLDGNKVFLYCDGLEIADLDKSPYTYVERWGYLWAIGHRMTCSSCKRKFKEAELAER